MTHDHFRLGADPHHFSPARMRVVHETGLGVGARPFDGDRGVIGVALGRGLEGPIVFDRDLHTYEIEPLVSANAEARIQVRVRGRRARQWRGDFPFGCNRSAEPRVRCVLAQEIGGRRAVDRSSNRELDRRIEGLSQRSAEERGVPGAPAAVDTSSSLLAAAAREGITTVSTACRSDPSGYVALASTCKDTESAPMRPASVAPLGTSPCRNTSPNVTGTFICAAPDPSAISTVTMVLPIAGGGWFGAPSPLVGTAPSELPGGFVEASVSGCDIDDPGSTCELPQAQAKTTKKAARFIATLRAANRPDPCRFRHLTNPTGGKFGHGCSSTSIGLVDDRLRAVGVIETFAVDPLEREGAERVHCDAPQRARIEQLASR